MIKHLITGGCSFSHGPFPQDNWTGKLENNLRELNPNLTREHTGYLSQGQELIQKKVTLAIMDALDKGISSSDILVVVMWSGTYRKAFYIDNHYILNKMRNDWKQFEGGMSGQFLDLKNKLNGEIITHRLNIDKTWEGKIVMFPSYLMHTVYPFFTSDEYRISIAGNIHYYD